MTTLTKQRQQKAEKLAESISKAGFNCDPYKRNPWSGDMNFAISIPNNKVRVWQGDTEPEVRISKKHTQSVVTLQEDKRLIPRVITIPHWRVRSIYKKLDEGFELDPRDVDELRSSIPGFFGIQITGARFKLNEVIGVSDSTYSSGIRVAVTATAPAFHSSFLTGIDETAPFVAELPEVVKTVAEAHEVLRPQNVPKNALRQGEWFFVPVNKKEQQRITKAFTSGGRPPTVRHGSLESRGWQPSSHQGTYCVVDGERYYIGVIHDMRRSRHRPVVLDGWHRAIRNREVLTRDATARSWD